MRGLRLALLALGVMAPSALRAQVTAQVGASVDISTTALTAGQLADLSFGNVVPGVPTAIDAQTGASAGQFEVTGNRNAEIQITMTLPAQLSTGFWTMPISFGPTSGCWRKLPGQNGCNYWDPNTVLIERIRNQNFPNNRFFVWIGGTVSPAAAQNPGVYLGTVRLTVAYTGN